VIMKVDGEIVRIRRKVDVDWGFRLWRGGRQR